MIIVILSLAIQTPAPPAVLEISAKGCKVRIDGKRVGLDALRARVHELGREKRELQLRPDAGVTPDCLVKVAAAVRAGHP